MKKLICFLSCMAALLLVAPNIKAQICIDNFTVETQVTASTCMGNGKIVVTLSGETADLVDIQYGLSAVGGGLTVAPSSANVFDNLPSGSYNLTVQAFCPYDRNWSVTRNISNVVVEGDYEVPQASLNSTISRNSYSDCPMGIIALNVTGGVAPFTFTVVSAPAGAPVSPGNTVNVTQSGIIYTLDGQNWPAGDYKIQVSDNCYNAMANFTLTAISGFPGFYYTGSSGSMNFRADIDHVQAPGACNVVGWIPYSDAVAANPDYLRYFNDGLYEIGSAPLVGGVAQPAANVTNWMPWTSYTNSTNSMVWLNLGANNLKQFYSSGTSTIAIYTRVKDCSDASTNFGTYIRIPYISTSLTSSPSCNKIQTRVWSDYDGLLCYPLTLTITQNGEEIYSNSNWLYNVNSTEQIPVDMSNGTYTINFQDQDGTVIPYLTLPSFSFNRYVYPTCNDYNFYYSVTAYGMSASCSWLAIVTTTEAATGTVIGIDTLYNSSYILSSYKLQYDTAYSLLVQYANGSTANYSNYTQSSTLTPTFTLYQSNACAVNSGNFWIYNYYWPIGTVFDITGPDGFTPYSTTTTSLGYYLYLPSSSTYLNMPPGDYTLTYYLGGDRSCPKTITYKFPGAYNYTGFGYTQEQTCGGMDIKPTGTVTYQGVNQTTYFRLVNGPSGYNTSVISSGGSITLKSSGVYVLGIQQSNSSTGCTLATDTIYYTAQPLSLDSKLISAYVCVGGTVGDVSVSAINGVAPYTYSMWDESNTVKLVADDIITDGIAHFTYGTADSTYTIRVSDNCGSSFNQKVTLNDLKTARIVYSLDQNACTGGSVQLECITLGTTTYSWTGPNGYTSTSQNPLITDVDSTMTGFYKVSVTPEYCGRPVEDSIYIHVCAPLTAVEVDNQEFCAGSAVVVHSETIGGSGNYTYQWQSGVNGVSGWTDISGATNETYSPASPLTVGTYYYRRQTTDELCGSVYSDPITIVLKACFAPVNPKLRSLPKR